MRASSIIRPNGARCARGNASRIRRGLVVASVAALLGSVVLLSGAEARLSVIPGRTSNPRPTTTPQVVGSKAGCQEQIRGASAELAGGVRAAFAACLGASLPCIFEQAGSAACCAGATPACIRESEEIAAAGAAFVADVVAPPCSTLPFAELIAGERPRLRPHQRRLPAPRPTGRGGRPGLARDLPGAPGHAGRAAPRGEHRAAARARGAGLHGPREPLPGSAARVPRHLRGPSR